MYAKIINGQLTYPTAEEFPGVCGWERHDPALRAAGYMPLQGVADEREGYTAVPSTWEVVTRTDIRTEPRQVERDGNAIIEDVEVEVDASFINVLSWEYVEIPTPEPDEPVDWDDLGDLPTTFSKWELIQAWQGTGDLDNLLSSVGTGKQNLLVAWSSLPDTIDLQEILTRWAAMVAMASGGGVISKENIQSWLTYIKEHRQ